MGTNDSQEKVVSIQLLRAFAATLVVLDHSFSQVASWPDVPNWLPKFGWFLGEQGVAIFFVISGFIMTVSAKGFGTPFGGMAFFMRRLLRVAPIYWLFTMVAFALIHEGLWLKGREVSVADLLKSLAFIPYGNPPMRPVLGQGWTLVYEMAFYLIFAFSMLLPSKRQGVMAVIFVLVGAVAIGELRFQTFTVQPRQPFSYFLAPYLLLFASGILISIMSQRGIGQIRARTVFSIILALLSVSAISFLMFMPNFEDFSWRLLFWSIDVLVVVVALKAAVSAPGPASRIVVLLGDASYSLYLSHIFIVYIFAKLWRILVGQVFPFGLVSAIWIVSALIAVLIFRYIERPIHSFARASFNRSGRGRETGTLY